jgi:2,3-bisphosphoglycerate-independent phosphoglycerate mutase
LAIELIDKKVISPLLKGMEQYDDYKLMVLPDHATPISIKTHSSDPVPYVIYQKSKQRLSTNSGYDELSAKNSGIHQNSGTTLLSRFLQVEPK